MITRTGQCIFLSHNFCTLVQEGLHVYLRKSAFLSKSEISVLIEIVDWITHKILRSPIRVSDPFTGSLNSLRIEIGPVISVYSSKEVNRPHFQTLYNNLSLSLMYIFT